MDPNGNKESVSCQVAEYIISQITDKPNSCIGLPTGRTPLEMYAKLQEIFEHRKPTINQAKFFGLDEYLQVEERHSFKHYLEDNFYHPLSIKKENCFNPLEHDDYDSLIAVHGGLDLTILGIGTNGHIAFNEPTTPEQSWTHCSSLDESTKLANQDFFLNAKTPDKAVTMGIQTILASRKVILMAFGEEKRSILESAFSGPVNPKIPASFLKSHKNLQICTDFEFG